MEHVFLARHGETEWNRIGRRQGHLDSPLTAEGLAATHRASARVAAFDADAVFASSLGRALTTASIYAAALGHPVVALDELRELDHGEMSGLTGAEIEARYPGALARRSLDRYGSRFLGGESYADLDRRAAIALRRVASFGVARPLVVSHEMIGRMLLRNLLDLEPRAALKMNQPHGLVYRVDLVTRELSEIRLDVA